MKGYSKEEIPRFGKLLPALFKSYPAGDGNWDDPMIISLKYTTGTGTETIPGTSLPSFTL
jgi:hypothetical protein